MLVSVGSQPFLFLTSSGFIGSKPNLFCRTFFFFFSWAAQQRELCFAGQEGCRFAAQTFQEQLLCFPSVNMNFLSQYSVFLLGEENV